MIARPGKAVVDDQERAVKKLMRFAQFRMDRVGSPVTILMKVSSVVGKRLLWIVESGPRKCG